MNEYTFKSEDGAEYKIKEIKVLARTASKSIIIW